MFFIFFVNFLNYLIAHAQSAGPCPLVALGGRNAKRREEKRRGEERKGEKRGGEARGKRQTEGWRETGRETERGGGEKRTSSVPSGALWKLLGRFRELFGQVGSVLGAA